jgi:transposase
MGRKVYPSDISREECEAIRGMLEATKHRTSPREVDLYDKFCAILYLLKNGCTWRANPGDVPGWTTVRYYCDQWSHHGTDDGTSLLERALKNQETRARGKQAGGKDDVVHRGRAKRENHGDGATKRV